MKPRTRWFLVCSSSSQLCVANSPVLSWLMTGSILVSFSVPIDSVEAIATCTGGYFFYFCNGQNSIMRKAETLAKDNHPYKKIFNPRKPKQKHRKLAIIRSPDFTPWRKSRNTS